jgi:hypothetical protein
LGDVFFKMKLNSVRVLFSCMNRDDEYQQKAEEARKLADLSPSELHRERWLRLARGWLDLVRRRPRATDQEEK